MRRICFACAALALFATSAFAAGADLSVVACPGSAGASSDAGNLDCASGAQLTLLVVFQPAESAPDLTGIDVIIDMSVAGALATNASFWDLETANAASLSNGHVRPSPPTCSAYTASWAMSGSGEGTLGFTFGPQMIRIKALAYRPGPLAYTVNQKLFGMTVTIDGSNAAEAGGTGEGCALPVTFVLDDVFPRLISGNPTQDLSFGASFGNVVTVNSVLTPTTRRTWGQLKSLYR